MPSSQVRLGARNSLPCFALGSGALLPPGFEAIEARARAAPSALAREGCGEGWGAWGRRRAAERRSRAGWHSGAGTGLEAGREAYRASGVSGGHERTPPSVGDGGVAGSDGRLGRHRRDHAPRRRTPDAASTPLLTEKRGRMRRQPRANHPLRSGSFLAAASRVILSDMSNFHPAPLESRDMPQRPPDCSGGRGGASFHSFG